MSRRPLTLVVPTLLAVLAVCSAPAAPPFLEGLGQYRVVDASGRIAPRGAGGPGDRVVMRPSSPPPLLLRGRPYFITGYPGTSYAPASDVAPAAHRARAHGFGLFGGH